MPLKKFRVLLYHGSPDRQMERSCSKAPSSNFQYFLDLLQIRGYYDSLKALLDKMIEKGLSTPQRQRGIRFAANLEEITTILNKA